MQTKITKAEETTLLEAAKNGDLAVIQEYSCLHRQQQQQPPSSVLASITDSSGCTMLHWAAGNNHEATLRHLLTIFHPDTQVKSKQAFGRTALHYACRNGHLSIVKTLVEHYDANIHIRSKAGVTAFQLAVWQNQMHICTYLTNPTYCKIPVRPKEEINDFGCGIIHWLGIIPIKRSDNSNNIITMAQWIIEDHGVDVYSKQNMGHTVLHKAAWGGHLNLVQYLHEVHDMYDDSTDHAGNYAADLCDMANTERHAEIASYLRKECSLEYKESCRILGIEKHSSEETIRKAYLRKARGCHPDRAGRGRVFRNENSVGEDENVDIDVEKDSSRSHGNDEEFQLVKGAYEHLMSGGRATKQNNPAHSIHLLLEMQTKHSNEGGETSGIGNPRNEIEEEEERKVKEEQEGDKYGIDSDELKLFKTRLVAVLLEFGEKGLDLSNIPKKWNQVWPDVKFPSLEQKQNGRRKKGRLLQFIKEYAGDVVKISRQKHNGQVRVLISPRNITTYRENFPWVASNNLK